MEKPREVGEVPPREYSQRFQRALGVLAKVRRGSHLEQVIRAACDIVDKHLVWWGGHSPNATACTDRYRSLGICRLSDSFVEQYGGGQRRQNTLPGSWHRSTAVVVAVFCRESAYLIRFFALPFLLGSPVRGRMRGNFFALWRVVSSTPFAVAISHLCSLPTDRAIRAVK